MPEERLQKIMSAAGVGSRRACEKLIVAGRVQVNGRTVTELGAKADLGLVQVTVDGKPLHLPKRHTYYKLHKPRGVLSDIGGDTRDRKTVADFLPAEMHRVFPVGRLDLGSEGLMLLTDDGDLAHKLTHPRFEHPKTYFVLLEHRPSTDALAHLRAGVELPEGRTAPAKVRVISHLPAGLSLGPGVRDGIWLEIILREGKKRQIRHMTAAIGHPTMRLVRWAIGGLTLGELKPGESAPLSHHEVAALRQSAQDSSAQAKQGQPRNVRSQAALGPRPGGRPRSRPARQSSR